MDGYFYYEGGILKHHRTPGSKNGVSTTPGYTAQGQVAQMTSDGHYASQYGSSTQSQILAKNPYYTGDKVREEDRMMEDARQKSRQEVQANPQAYAAQRQVEHLVDHDRKDALKRHAKKLRASIDNSDEEVRYRRAHRGTLGNLVVDALSDIGTGVKKVAKKTRSKASNKAKILGSYIRSIKNNFRR